MIPFEPHALMKILIKECHYSFKEQNRTQTFHLSNDTVVDSIVQTILLPGALEKGYGLGVSLKRRASIRRYAKQPISLAAARTILCSAHQGDNLNWGEESGDGLPLTLLLVAQNVDGLQYGFYQYLPRTNELLSLRLDHDCIDLEQLVAQREFTKASALLLISGNLSRAVARNGSHGYRQLILRAGAAAHHGWLAALSLGVGGCLFAGLFSNEFEKLGSVDRFTRSPLFGLAIGFNDSQSERSYLS